MQLVAVAITPFLFGLVLPFEIHCARIPVVLLASYIVAAFQQQDSLSGLGQLVSEGSTTRPGADDDHVEFVLTTHDAPPCPTHGSCIGKCSACCYGDAAWRRTLYARPANRSRRRATFL